GANQAQALQDGTYYVVATNNTSVDGNDGCFNTPAISVTIQQFEPTYSVESTVDDFSITHLDDCDPFNGAYEILRVTASTRSGGTNNTTALTDYTFTWYDNDALGAANELDDALIVGANNGDAGAAEVTGLGTGTYYVVIQSVSTGCPSGDPQVHSFTIDDNR